MEQEILNRYSDLYSRIWIQRSKYRLCVTVFPHVGQYRMFISQDDLYHGFSEETNIEDVISLIDSRQINDLCYLN